MHTCKDIEENRVLRHGGPNLHITNIAQVYPEDNPVKLLQKPINIRNNHKTVYYRPFTGQSLKPCKRQIIDCCRHIHDY